MSKNDLSFREEEIVDLAIEGLTNDAIAMKLGISVGTVNTYWLRIRMKVGGLSRTDTVVKVLGKRAKADRDSLKVEDARKASLELPELQQAIGLMRAVMGSRFASAWVATQ